jgi:hypothetical protein
VEDSFISEGYYLAGPLNKISELCYTYENIEDYVEQSKEEE